MPGAYIAGQPHGLETGRGVRRAAWQTHRSQANRKPVKLQGGWKTRDFIVTAAIAVVLGLVWSLGWVHAWQVARGILPEFGFFMAGFYTAAAVITGYIVRRPGAALLGEMIAAIIEVPLTVLGPTALILGLLQGLGVEMVFAATGYRKWNLTILLLAGAAGAALGYVYETFAFGYLAMTSGSTVVPLCGTGVGWRDPGRARQQADR